MRLKPKTEARLFTGSKSSNTKRDLCPFVLCTLCSAQNQKIINNNNNNNNNNHCIRFSQSEFSLGLASMQKKYAKCSSFVLYRRSLNLLRKVLESLEKSLTFKTSLVWKPSENDFGTREPRQVAPFRKMVN